MIAFEKQIDLQSFNTFGLPAKAKLFVVVRSVDDVRALLATPEFKSYPHLILGGGSNVLLTKDFDGLVIKNEIKGIDVIAEDDDTVTIKVGAGEHWHDLVLFAIDKGWGGIENLSLIPGTVGAAPMQNIGAYGVEAKNSIHAVEVIELASGELSIISNEACRFGYRESIFKHEWKDKYFISSVTLTLSKRDHKLNISYGAIHDVLKQSGHDVPTLRSVSDAVISIRRSKLPDPKIIGNAGSFFKNPSVTAEKLESLKEVYPTIPFYPDANGLFKIPAAWLIESCGWKGKKIDHIGVHAHQALVLVNYGGGNGYDIWQLAMKIQESVREKFDITLQAEVNVIG